jgi:hypothetical protein
VERGPDAEQIRLTFFLLQRTVCTVAREQAYSYEYAWPSGTLRKEKAYPYASCWVCWSAGRVLEGSRVGPTRWTDCEEPSDESLEMERRGRSLHRPTTPD